MAKDNLLRDAIADAKTVKEAALANAMLTLKEAFKPKLDEMLAKQIKEEETVDEQKKLSSSDIGSNGVAADDPGPKKPSAASSSSSDIENPGLEVDTFGEGVEVNEDFDDDEGHEGDQEFRSHRDDNFPEGGPAAEAAVGTDDVETGDDQYADDQNVPHGDAADAAGDFEGDDDLDLEAIIRELEADLRNQDMGGGDEMGGDEHMHGEDEMHEAVPFGKGNVNKKPQNEEAVEEDWQTARAGMFSGKDVDLRNEGEAEGVEKSGKDVAAKDGVPGGQEVKPGKEVSAPHEDKMEEDIDLQEVLREVEAESMMYEAPGIATENAELKRSLREHREVIKLLRNRINEVTLLNSKLMYATRVFRNFNLSEGQKRRVIEQLDRAGTLREAKLVYSTLAESLSGKVGTGTPRKIVNKITEGASKVVGSTKPKTDTRVLTEEKNNNQLANRMKKLAGIIKE